MICLQYAYVKRRVCSGIVYFENCHCFNNFSLASLRQVGRWGCRNLCARIRGPIHFTARRSGLTSIFTSLSGLDPRQFIATAPFFCQAPARTWITSHSPAADFANLFASALRAWAWAGRAFGRARATVSLRWALSITVVGVGGSGGIGPLPIPAYFQAGCFRSWRSPARPPGRVCHCRGRQVRRLLRRIYSVCHFAARPFAPAIFAQFCQFRVNFQLILFCVYYVSTGLPACCSGHLGVGSRAPGFLPGPAPVMGWRGLGFGLAGWVRPGGRALGGHPPGVIPPGPGRSPGSWRYRVG